MSEYSEAIALIRVYTVDGGRIIGIFTTDADVLNVLCETLQGNFQVRPYNHVSSVPGLNIYRGSTDAGETENSSQTIQRKIS